MWYPVDRELAVSFCIDPNADAEWRRRYDTFARVVLAPIPEEQQPARATMTENPEQAVIDQIDALVNESLAHGPTDDYERPWQERCDTCYGEWHGLPAFGCPGAYATPEQHAEYLQSHRPNIGHIPIWPTYTYYESFAPGTAVNDQALEGYTDIGYVDSVESVHIHEDRPAFPNIESQSGTTEYTTSWTLTELSRMRERAWLTRTYDQTPTFDAPILTIPSSQYWQGMTITRWEYTSDRTMLMHDIRCAQCQRSLGTITANTPHIEALCTECHDMQRNARERIERTQRTQQRMTQAIATLTHGYYSTGQPITGTINVIPFT